jgi:C4-dicarboxylate transporter
MSPDLTGVSGGSNGVVGIPMRAAAVLGRGSPGICDAGIVKSGISSRFRSAAARRLRATTHPMSMDIVSSARMMIVITTLPPNRSTMKYRALETCMT